jgi:hypothetical protein
LRNRAKEKHLSLGTPNQVAATELVLDWFVYLTTVKSQKFPLTKHSKRNWLEKVYKPEIRRADGSKERAG